MKIGRHFHRIVQLRMYPAVAQRNDVPKNFPDLTDAQRTEVGEFLQALDEHDDVHRVWAAVK